MKYETKVASCQPREEPKEAKTTAPKPGREEQKNKPSSNETSISQTQLNKILGKVATVPKSRHLPAHAKAPFQTKPETGKKIGTRPVSTATQQRPTSKTRSFNSSAVVKNPSAMRRGHAIGNAHPRSGGKSQQRVPTSVPGNATTRIGSVSSAAVVKEVDQSQAVSVLLHNTNENGNPTVQQKAPESSETHDRSEQQSIQLEEKDSEAKPFRLSTDG